MKTTLDNCLKACTAECLQRSQDLYSLHYFITDINEFGFSIVPSKGSSFYSWKTFYSIVEFYHLSCYFRTYTHLDNSVSVCLRVII